MRIPRSEQANIIHMEPDDIQGCTGVVEVRVKNKILTCFTTDYSETFAPLIQGTEIRVFLILETVKKSIIGENNIQKTIDFSENPYIPFHCSLSGHIVEIIVNENNTPYEKVYHNIAIVDCGVLVNVPVNPDLDIHIGDSISAEGRLDIELV